MNNGKIKPLPMFLSVIWLTPFIQEISKVCSIKTDFFPEMFSELGEKTDMRGNRYRVLDYSLHMKVTAEDLEWLVYFEDQKKGHQQFSIDYE